VTVDNTLTVISTRRLRELEAAEYELSQLRANARLITKQMSWGVRRDIRARIIRDLRRGADE
jgi:hypothetical protein